MTIKQARMKAGYTIKEISDWLEIPYRTLQNWDTNLRPCPVYVEKLIVEKILKKKENEEEKTIYRDKNYDRMELAVPKGMKKIIEETAKEQGFSSKNSYVVEALKEKYKRDTGHEMKIGDLVEN